MPLSAPDSAIRRFRSPAHARAIASLGTGDVLAAGKFTLEREGGAHWPETGGLPPLSNAGESFFALSEPAQAAAPVPETSALDYHILVSTLRCNLSCSYCEVSQASVNQPRVDCSKETLGHVLDAPASLTTSSIKIEFQRGGPHIELRKLA